ncbi:MAG: hypothetical protein AABX47_10250 [Nanoarchaeota archaeon]
MEPIFAYLTTDGWKRDLETTISDLKGAYRLIDTVHNDEQGSIDVRVCTGTLFLLAGITWTYVSALNVQKGYYQNATNGALTATCFYVCAGMHFGRAGSKKD